MSKPDIWSLIDKANDRGCWLWTGSLDPGGYGRYRSQRAHRAAWTLTNGPIPDGLWVLHHCDVRRCINPDHLYLGTRADNVRDAVVRDRLYHPPTKTHCKNGHAKTGSNLLWKKQRGKLYALCRYCDYERNRRLRRRWYEEGRYPWRTSDEFPPIDPAFAGVEIGETPK